MTPGWLSDVVRAFGRQLGLKTLALNERGTAGVRFENGRELRFEYSQGRLAVMVTLPVTVSGELARHVLAAAHPDARRGLRLRSGLFEKEGCAFFHATLAEREVAVDALERVFRELWSAAATVGRFS